MRQNFGGGFVPQVATEDISRRVDAIQVDTTGAVAAMNQISEIIAVEAPNRFRRPTYAGNAVQTVNAFNLAEKYQVPVFFLFPGQGSQHPGMARDLYAAVSYAQPLSPSLSVGLTGKLTLGENVMFPLRRHRDLSEAEMRESGLKLSPLNT